MLLGALRSNEMDDSNISDENVGLGAVFLSTVIVSIVFYFCYITFKINWAATFSVCVAWTTTFNNPINSLLIKQER